MIFVIIVMWEVCLCSGSIFALSCKCRMLVSSVQPVKMRSVVFYIVCSFVMFVADTIVEVHSSKGLVHLCM